MSCAKKEFKKRRNVETATLYKVEYVCYLKDTLEVESREFASIKSLNQWASRNDNDNTLGIAILRKLALCDGVWEPFTTIGKKTISLSDLKVIVTNLEFEGYNTSK